MTEKTESQATAPKDDYVFTRDFLDNNRYLRLVDQK